MREFIATGSRALSVLDKFEEGSYALGWRSYESQDRLGGRCMLVPIVASKADKSECGWQTVSEYLKCELVRDSDDEYNVFRATGRA